MSSSPPPTEAVVPLAEERLNVGRREVETGRVRITTRVDDHQFLVRDELRHDDVTIERVALDRPVESIPPVRQEGDVTIVSVVEEVLVVEKRLVLKEELHIRRRTRVEAFEQPVTLRRQRAVVDHLPGSGDTLSTDNKPKGERR